MTTPASAGESSLATSDFGSSNGMSSCTEAKPVKEKSENFGGENILLEYKDTKKAEGIQVHDRDVYVAENGDEFEYDAVTGQLVVFSNKNIHFESKTKISKDEALQIADELIKQYCDLSKYQLVDVTYNEYTGYAVNYSRFICNVHTSEVIWVSLTDDRKISSFIYNPYVFDGIEVQHINEPRLVAGLEEQIKESYGVKLVSYSINDKRLAVNENGNPQMEFFVAVEFGYDGQIETAGEIYFCDL